MNDSYNELLVRKETDGIQKVLRVVCVIPTAICALMGFGLANIIILILAIGFGVLDYFIYQWTDVEFEYLYLDKEISIDKIFAKSRRKKVVFRVIVMFFMVYFMHISWLSVVGPSTVSMPSSLMFILSINTTLSVGLSLILPWYTQ